MASLFKCVGRDIFSSGVNNLIQIVECGDKHEREILMLRRGYYTVKKSHGKGDALQNETVIRASYSKARVL